MAISLPDARLLSDEVLEALRRRALHGCELGYSEAEVAELLGLARETVCRWFSAYQAGGLEALPHNRSGRPLGSGRVLSEAQARHLQQLLDNHAPQEVGIAAPLWSRRAVRELIRQKLGIDLSVRAVVNYLRRWGYTAKKPGRHRKDQDPEEVREWLEEVYPGIEERAAKQGATIHWCDEIGAQADQHPGKGYAPKGQPAIMEVPDSHIKVNMISTISNDGAAHFMTYTQNMTAALFILFLKRLLRSTTGKIFLIVDWLRAHEAQAVQAWVEAHEQQIELYFLPRYAPELNPAEYLNHDLKSNVNAQGLPESRAVLRSRIQAFMQRLLHLPSHVRNYFQHPCARYASAL